MTYTSAQSGYNIGGCISKGFIPHSPSTHTIFQLSQTYSLLNCVKVIETLGTYELIKMMHFNFLLHNLTHEINLNVRSARLWSLFFKTSKIVDFCISNYTLCLILRLDAKVKMANYYIFEWFQWVKLT